MNDFLICVTCGTQIPTPVANSIGCPICNDDRQYVPEGGQQWTTHDELLHTSSVRVLQLHERVYEFVIIPRLGIGQRAFLILSEQGNILWDCIALLNLPTIEFIKAKGGLKAIAFSHPHYYSNVNDWANIFDCPVYIHQEDEQWMIRKGERISPWEGEEKPLWDRMRLIRIGGHFPGSSILHVPALSEQGWVFCGDTLYVGLSMKHTAVMYSYPNRIPLPHHEVQRIKDRFDAIPFDALYGFESYQNVTENVKELINKSLARYLA